MQGGTTDINCGVFLFDVWLEADNFEYMIIPEVRGWSNCRDLAIGRCPKLPDIEVSLDKIHGE